MKKIIPAMFFLLLTSYAMASEAVNEIVICTPEWEQYTQTDGKGLYHELWRAVFEPEGVKPDVRYIPYKRCEKTFEAEYVNPYDAYPGGYSSESNILPKWHIGIEMLTVVYRKGFIPKWEGQKSMEGKRVIWERGYDFAKKGIVKADVERFEFSNLESGLKMLVSGRVDFLLDYESPVRKIAGELQITDRIEIVPNTIHGPKYYMIFSDTEKGRKLAEIWDERMEELYKSGKLKEMYKRYDDLSYEDPI